MGKDTLFMLNPWLEGEQGPYYCPDCGVIEGFFAYSPEIRAEIEIISVDFPRPRTELVTLLGLENQESPVLVLADDAREFAGTQQSMSTGKKFINDAMLICNYLGEVYKGVLPHP